MAVVTPSQAVQSLPQRPAPRTPPPTSECPPPCRPTPFVHLEMSYVLHIQPQLSTARAPRTPPPSHERSTYPHGGRQYLQLQQCGRQSYSAYRTCTVECMPTGARREKSGLRKVPFIASQRSTQRRAMCSARCSNHSLLHLSLIHI